MVCGGGAAQADRGTGTIFSAASACSSRSKPTIPASLSWAVAVSVVLLAQRPLEILQVLVGVGRAAPGRTSFRTPTVAIFFTGFTAASHMRAQSSAAAVALGPGSRGGITFVLFARARAVVPQTVALTY